ncbi:hypothetical protein Bbelb_193370 [Branchiostoma belcheri]|nr:hypothetical protein Bbelb_193370 [Branchiostoma belcheri]
MDDRIHPVLCFGPTADAINATLSKIRRSLPRLDINHLPAFLPAPQPPQLRNVRTRKAAGPDNITGRFIKEFAFELSQPLTSILNASSNEGHVPKEWYEATVTPLPKTKPPKVCELRPVSLTSLLAKVCESFIAKWTMSDIITNIEPQQIGGLPGRSTAHCLVDILHHLSKTSDQRRTVSSILMTDFAKAFDMVDHATARQRLLELGCRPSLLSCICDLLTGRRQRVLYQGTLSTWEDLTCGLPQGTAIINCATKDVRARDWKFVDDLTIIDCRLLHQTSHLQEDLDTLERWSSESYMKLHPAKCKITRLNAVLPIRKEQQEGTSIQGLYNSNRGRLVPADANARLPDITYFTAHVPTLDPPQKTIQASRTLDFTTLLFDRRKLAGKAVLSRAEQEFLEGANACLMSEEEIDTEDCDRWLVKQPSWRSNKLEKILDKCKQAMEKNPKSRRATPRMRSAQPSSEATPTKGSDVEKEHTVRGKRVRDEENVQEEVNIVRKKRGRSSRIMIKDEEDLE